ncbi:hypothetical protein AAFC00_005160 [Neodothiora populina]|uniref:Alpha/beta hydrolase fold-3 domain-containing protein n=1 Tax=Neodothiora populina TaxID=2781224 RepID=A0ABR3PK10_9PEZI
MLGIFSRILRYLRLKANVSILRFFTWWRNGMPKAFPDAVLRIPSRDAGRTIKANVYRPTTSLRPSPVLVNFHGSGYVFSLHGSDDTFCRKVSNETSYTVLDIQYSLAPERPFPAAVDDGEDVVKWVLQQPDAFDASSISIGGFSAGAALSLAHATVNFPKGTFKSLICFYPPCDLSASPEERVAKVPDPDGHPIPAAIDRLFSSAYVPLDIDRKDPRVSPSFAPVENVPDNVLMITCARDSLCLDAEAVAARIEEAGKTNVVRRRMAKCDHAWDKNARTPEEVAARDEAYALAVQMLSA